MTQVVETMEVEIAGFVVQTSISNVHLVAGLWAGWEPQFGEVGFLASMWVRFTVTGAGALKRPMMNTKDARRVAWPLRPNDSEAVPGARFRHGESLQISGEDVPGPCREHVDAFGRVVWVK